MQSRPRSPAPVPLAALLAACKTGDAGALEQIVERYYPRIELAVQQRLRRRDPRAADRIPVMFSTGDVVHGMFMRVLGKPLRLEQSDENTLIAYLIRAVETQIIDMTRYHHAARRDARRLEAGKELSEVLDARGEGAASPTVEARANEHQRIFQDELESFVPEQQRLLQLRLEQRLGFQEIAAALGFATADAARKAFNAAKARLLIRLRRRGLGTQETAL